MKMVSFWSLLVVGVAVLVAEGRRMGSVNDEHVKTEQVKLGSDEMWSDFKKRIGKVYENDAEDVNRRAVWESNLKKIKEHNERAERGEFTYKLGETYFADMTVEEFKEKYLSDLSDYAESVDSLATEVFEALPEHMLPTDVNWKDKMTPVKFQGKCAAGYAFSPTATIEGHVAIKRGGLVSLSAQQLVDCADSKGCGGGNPRVMYKYIHYKKLMKWSDYPFTFAKSTCKYWPTKVTNARVSGLYVIPDESHLMTALYHVGPASVVVDATHFALYKSGIYNGACTTNVNHPLTAVGYGTGYWLLKNSFGTSWGESGYMRLARKGTNFCGIVQYGEFPKVYLA